nr:collagenase [Euryarchaeota archaeon]
MKRLLFALTIMLISSSSLLAQHSCAHTEQRKKMQKEHPELIPAQEARRQFLENFTHNFSANQSVQSSVNLLIPIVFHVVHDNGVENISDAQIHESIVQLNEDYAAVNPELVDVHPNFTDLIANVGFEFRLAELDPNGEPTTGINRIQSELTYNGSDIALKQMIQWDPTMYLNIWVVYSSNGGNGSAFAYYPADVEGSGSIYDGVVSSYWAVGRTETAVWTHYKILTHEVGHWANLKHTWGDQSNNQSLSGCSYDDAVEDTPNTIGNTGCDLEAISCET